MSRDPNSSKVVREAADLTTIVPTGSIPCLGASQIVFTLTATDAGTLSAISFEVSDDGVAWLANAAGVAGAGVTSVTGLATPAASTFNTTPGKAIAVSASSHRGIFWNFMRLQVTATTTVSGLRIFADVYNYA
jgi:hypothetical protein